MTATPTPEPMICQWPIGVACPEEVVAKIGLPGPPTIWVCKKHFNEWEEKPWDKEPDA